MNFSAEKLNDMSEWNINHKIHEHKLNNISAASPQCAYMKISAEHIFDNITDLTYYKRSEKK